MNDAIARWWNAFRNQAPRIDALFHGTDEFDLPEWMGSVLRAGHLPERTWLLYHDSELRFQRRGLYDDTPAPPMPVLE